MARFYLDSALYSATTLELPAAAARHVQVLRLQPGAALTLFNGQGGEFAAVVEQIGRSTVRVRLGRHDPVEREAARAVHLMVGMPANERMDWLLEKATELGAASITPLHTQRSVLRLDAARAARKQAHWRSVAAAACEQCGRNRLPTLHPVTDFGALAARLTALGLAARTPRLLLSLQADSRPWPPCVPEPAAPVCLLSGPEGGFSPDEEDAARALGFVAVSLGARVLRAETAPLALLAALLLS